MNGAIHFYTESLVKIVSAKLQEKIIPQLPFAANAQAPL